MGEVITSGLIILLLVVLDTLPMLLAVSSLYQEGDCAFYVLTAKDHHIHNIAVIPDCPPVVCEHLIIVVRMPHTCVYAAYASLRPYNPPFFSFLGAPQMFYPPAKRDSPPFPFPFPTTLRTSQNWGTFGRIHSLSSFCSSTLWKFLQIGPDDERIGPGPDLLIKPGQRKTLILLSEQADKLSREGSSQNRIPLITNH